jgi:integrase
VVEPLRSHLLGLVEQGWKGVFCPELAKVSGSGRSMSFRRLLKAAGVGMERRAGKGAQVYVRSFHCLRHTLTTWMAAGGVADSTRMLVTGHSNKKTHARYTHEMMEAKRKALAMKRQAVETGLSILIASDVPVG